jgi:hypothetical protein
MNIPQNTVYLIVIAVLMILQIFQWYYIIGLRKQVHSIWAQIITIAIVMSQIGTQKNDQEERKD